MCTGIHEDCKLHITKGVLHNQTTSNAKTDYVKRIKEENLHVYKKNFLLTRQNILSLSNLLKRALLTRTERELCTSEYGTICPEKLWNLGRTDNSMLFKRELLQDNSDFAVEVLIDASGSQPVSYTHLDVYKRQEQKPSVHNPFLLFFSLFTAAFLFSKLTQPKRAWASFKFTYFY